MGKVQCIAVLGALDFGPFLKVTQVATLLELPGKTPGFCLTTPGLLRMWPIVRYSYYSRYPLTFITVSWVKVYISTLEVFMISTSPLNTFSIVAHCPRTDMLGVGVASKYMAVGAICSHTQAGVGAVSTQSYGNPYLAIDGLELLQQGFNTQETLELVLQQDPGREKRQLIMVNHRGEAAAFTGSLATPWYGHHQGQGYVVAGNMLTDETVIQAMADVFEQSVEEELAERLLQTLEAGQQVGGDKRGRQAAHLQVVHTEAWKYVDLRVDDHPNPIGELRRIFEVAKRELFPFRILYPTRSNPGADWDLDEYERISSLISGKQ